MKEMFFLTSSAWVWSILHPDFGDGGHYGAVSVALVDPADDPVRHLLHRALA